MHIYFYGYFYALLITFLKITVNEIIARSLEKDFDQNKIFRIDLPRIILYVWETSILQFSKYVHINYLNQDKMVL